MDALVDPFLANDFMQRALVAGLATVVTTSLVGTWMVLRGLTFLGDAIAHGVLPGIAVAAVIGASLDVGAVISALVMVGGITLVGHRSRLPDDASIGLLFVGMLALGVTILSFGGSFATDVVALLFGDAIGVTGGDVVAAGSGAAVAVALSVLLYRPFLVLTFSRDKAAVLGFRPGWTHAAMLVLIGLAIVASFRTLGTLLVFAFLVAPPAAASLVARRVPVLMVVAVSLGAVAVVVGLLLSFHAGLPASPAIAVTAVGEFFVVLAGREVADALRARRQVAPA